MNEGKNDCNVMVSLTETRVKDFFSESWGYRSSYKSIRAGSRDLSSISSSDMNDVSLEKSFFFHKLYFPHL